MRTQNYYVIGVMSGTSLDGIDLVYLRLSYSGNWSFEILASDCVEYSSKWKERLRDGIQLDGTNLKKLNNDYTAHLAGICNNFIKHHSIKNAVAICSHGHTISHDPTNGHTLQIGNLSSLAALTHHRVVCDFRVEDVQLGGQGAPLVPIGDQLLFSAYDYCLNLGGFANISFDRDGNRMAFDICAVNVILNHYAQLLGKEFDDDGAFAKAGTPQPSILKKLDALPFYKLPAPKSLGIEWAQSHVFPILNSIQDPQDAIATFTHHIAGIIAATIPPKASVIVTGGGAYNTYLMQLIQEDTGGSISIPESAVVEYKEAVIFGLLGVLRLRNENNCLASVTGASRDHCSGKIYTP